MIALLIVPNVPPLLNALFVRLHTICTQTTSAITHVLQVFIRKITFATQTNVKKPNAGRVQVTIKFACLVPKIMKYNMGPAFKPATNCPQ